MDILPAHEIPVLNPNYTGIKCLSLLRNTLFLLPNSAF